MKFEAIAVLADPKRRTILGTLLKTDLCVGEVCSATGIAQPSVSKHLKVLREAGFVSRRTASGRQIYSLDANAFMELDAWLEPYRQLWTKHLDALEVHLDREEKK